MPARVPSSRRLSVLLVEDDRAVAAVINGWLRGAGYEVAVAHNSREGLALAEAVTDPVDILVIDVMLPGMSGPVLAGALRRLHPESAVLFTSGYSPELVAEISAPHTSNAVVLRKPFHADELMSKIALAIARRPRPSERPGHADRPDPATEPADPVPTSRA